MTSDRQLVERARAGDRSALDQLVARHLRPTFGVAYALTGSADESDEVVQEAMLSALRRLAELRDADRFGPWLATIVRRCVAVRRRQEKRRREVEGDTQRARADSACWEDSMDRRDDHRLLLAAVHELPEKLRLPLVLHYFEHQSTPAVARRLGLSPETARKRIQLARDRLRDRLVNQLGTALGAIGPAPCLAKRILSDSSLTIGSPAAGAQHATLPASASGATSTGLLTLGALAMKSKLAILAGALLLVSIAAWVVGTWEGPPATIESPGAPGRSELAGTAAAETSPIVSEAGSPSSEAASEAIGSTRDDESVPSDMRFGKISGRIVRSTTREPVNRARLLLFSRSTPGQRFGASSDEEGRFSFEEIPAGTWILTDPRSPIAREVALTEDATHWHFAWREVSLEAGDHRDVLLLAELRFAVAGIVVEAGSERPVPDLPLALVRAGEDSTDLGKTDAEGRFRSTGHEAGRFVIVAPGLASELGPVADFVFAALELSEEHDATGLHLELPWTGRLSGRVQDPEGEPVAGANVTLAGAESASLHIEPREMRGRSAETGEDGRFVFERLPLDRNLALVIVAEGFAPQVERSLQATSGESDPIVITMSSGATVRGRVIGPSGAPLPEAHVGVTPFQHVPEPRGVETGVDGSFEIRGLSPGAYVFVVREYRTTLGTDPGWLERRVEVPPEGIDDLELRLEPVPSGRIAGVVVDEEGLPFEDFVHVHAIPMSEEGSRMATPVSDGRFELRFLEPGRYRVASRDVRYACQPQEVDTGTDDVRLVLRRGVASGSLLVRVVDERSGELIPGADVLVEVEGSIGLVRHTGLFGETRIENLAPQRCTIWTAARGRAPERIDVELRAGDEKELVQRLSPGRAVEGRVIARSGQPAPGARVGVLLHIGGSGYELRSTVVATDDQGRFRIDSLPSTGGHIGLVRGRWLQGMLEPVPAGQGPIELVAPW